jgi:nitroreductase
LQAYVDFNRSLGLQLPDIYEIIGQTLQNIQIPHNQAGGGVKTVTSAHIMAASSVDFGGFAGARHSIRNFTADPVDGKLIEKAVEIAQRTPSVCNRQPWHIYCFSEKQAIRNALKFQNGNDGFAENIQILLLVAGDLSAMMNSAERNEIWVDGGMFSMSLVYALHSLGLGTCCLNLCQNASEENRLRALVGITPHHSPVMMIAVGNIPETLSVAHSQRKLVKEVLTWK